MTSLNSENISTLLLPKLKENCDVGAGNDPGNWTVHTSTAFSNIANSLDYQAPGGIRSISSVPTMWARPLIMEMALHNAAHPLHSQMVEQWQGMLAAIALAEIRALPMTAKLVELRKLRSNAFANSLFELCPDPVNALYDQASHKNPWQDVYVFYWDNQPVGMTSPSTLVVPSESVNWTGLPWWQAGYLKSPIDSLNPNEKDLFWRWLDNLQRELPKHNGQQQAINPNCRAP